MHALFLNTKFHMLLCGDIAVYAWYKRYIIEKSSNLLHYLFQNPLAVDLVISLPQDGIRLIFDPVVQRLKVRLTKTLL